MWILTGQDAVNVAKNFNDKLGIDGVVLTKLDGVAEVLLYQSEQSQQTIKFVGLEA